MSIPYIHQHMEFWSNEPSPDELMNCISSLIDIEHIINDQSLVFHMHT